MFGAEYTLEGRRDRPINEDERVKVLDGIHVSLILSNLIGQPGHPPAAFSVPIFTAVDGRRL